MLCWARFGVGLYSGGAVRRPDMCSGGAAWRPGSWLWALFASGVLALGAVCVRGRGFGRGLCPGPWLWARFVSGASALGAGASWPLSVGAELCPDIAITRCGGCSIGSFIGV